MQTILALLDQHGAYFNFLLIALCSFFFSLPKDLSPLSAFSMIFQQIKVKVNLPDRSDDYKRLASILAFLMILLPIILIISQLYQVAFNPLLIDFVVLYSLLSWHDKIQAYRQISNKLQQNNLPVAKLLLSQLTLRDTHSLSLLGTNKAVIESLVLHLSNAWFTVIFWYLIGGIYAALFYQLIHICAQQWNCKLPENKALGQIPSLISGIFQLPVHILLSFTFALYDKPFKHFIGKFKQSFNWHHFSSGLLLSSFALSIQTQVGGVRLYGTDKITYARLGLKQQPSVDKILLAVQRLSLSAWFWLICITGYEFLPHIIDYFNSGYSQ